MPEICRFYGIIIQFFFREHAPPHFHASYGGYKAQFSIRELKIIEGTFPRRAMNLVLDWAELHQEELLVNWERCQAMDEPLKIEPLN